MVSVTIGVDIGQRVDPTAICVAEMEERARHPHGELKGERNNLEVNPSDKGPCEHVDDHYIIRHLERLTLGTPYPQVGRRVAQIAHGVVERTREYPMLYLDATGVGTPVLDALEEAGVEATLRAVYFTHGDRLTKADNGEIRLGKAYLVSRLQALLQSERLHLPKTPEAQQLAKELLDYEIKIDQNANDLYGAFKVGTHDDLVTALGLAVHAPFSGYTSIW
jgi:hypothetical protein